MARRTKYAGPELHQVTLSDGMTVGWWTRDGAPTMYVSPEEMTEWQIVERRRTIAAHARAGKAAKRVSPEGKAAEAAKKAKESARLVPKVGEAWVAAGKPGNKCINRIRPFLSEQGLSARKLIDLLRPFRINEKGKALRPTAKKKN
jgi:hypothetical protein